ncbi:MAG: peptidase domain-containing ABC transporter [Bacteroidia bacterium]
MYKKNIIELVELFASESGDKLGHFDIIQNKLDFNQNIENNFDKFIDNLNDIAEYAKYNFEIRYLSERVFLRVLKRLTYPLIGFSKFDRDLVPFIVKHRSDKNFEVIFLNTDKKTESVFKSEKEVIKLFKNFKQLNDENNCELNIHEDDEPPQDEDYIFITGFKFNLEISSEEFGKHLSPLARLYKLLKTEKQDVKYIYFFTIMIALVSLTLPLGIQAIIGLISGGLLLESVVVLIFLVVVATIASGWLQVQQLAMVEILQQRIFAQTALDFSFRIPRIKAEALIKEYAPELINRFFDVINVQKSLPKLLIDFSSAIIQIIFGLILLSFYHPLFIFFALFILSILAIIFYVTGKKGLDTSIKESKYKYKVAYWLEELGRSIIAFKLAGNSNLPVFKTDMLLEGYLSYRKKHFNILVKQYTAIVAFKTLVTAGLLIMGGLLVVNRQINLGQFVAAEIIIVLVITSVEKLITSISVVYDLLTALDKIGYVMDMPLENNAGKNVNELDVENKFNLVCNNVSYTYPNKKTPALKNISLTINTGEKVCIAGFNDAGKSTLLKVIAGLYNNYEGVITLNNLSLHELNIMSYRGIIGDNFNIDDIFEGTIMENISIGRSGVNLSDVLEACKKAHLLNFINELQEGLQTKVSPKGSNFPSNITKRILLARSFAHRSKLLIIDDFINNVHHKDKYQVISNVFNQPWAVLVVSNDVEIMKMCQNVYVLKNGSINAKGDYVKLVQDGIINEMFNK